MQLIESGIEGMRFKLETVSGVKGPCCQNTAVVRMGSNGRADLSCADCKSYRGRLSEEAIDRISQVLRLFPTAKDELHVIRDGELRFHGN